MHPTWTLIIVVVLALLLFSRPGKLSGLMEDLGKGISGFRKGMQDGSNPPAQNPAPPPAQVADQRTPDATGGDRVNN
ncbi:MAG: twin-arginine translocase TatA/TatE family subunit [Terricaulis silvestris]